MWLTAKLERRRGAFVRFEESLALDGCPGIGRVYQPEGMNGYCFVEVLDEEVCPVEASIACITHGKGFRGWPEKNFTSSQVSEFEVLRMVYPEPESIGVLHKG